MFLQASAPSPSPVPGIVLIASLCGAVIDWRYKRKGGKKPTKKDRLFFLAAIVLVAAVFASFWYIGGTTGSGPDIIGLVTVPIVVLLFGTWELGRWRVRRKNPLPKQSTSGVGADEGSRVK